MITVQEATPEPQAMRQWSDALAHVLQPRFLFPGKAALSDSDVYVRLAKGDPTEEVRAGTSISVGYIGENLRRPRLPRACCSASWSSGWGSGWFAGTS